MGQVKESTKPTAPPNPNIEVVCVALMSAERRNENPLFRRYVNSELSSFKFINEEIDSELWMNHKRGFPLIESEIVVILTLEEVLEKHEVVSIDFLKIDVQGLHLEVLLSAGKFLSSIDSLVLELPYFKDSSLYQDETTLVEALVILDRFGFIPTRSVSNEAGKCNVFLTSTTFGIKNYFQLEDLLKLQTAPTLKILPANKQPSRSKTFVSLARKHLPPKLVKIIKIILRRNK
jgi:FkbM family methyltransferase